MSKSSLVQVNVPAYEGNFTYGRSGRKIEAITIHHMAGVLSTEQCGKIFQRVGRYGSSHYGIGNDGKIGQYVDEENTAWTNSNWDSNCKSVTIETSNCENGGNWRVSDNALNSLIKLVADIGNRNNLGTLVKGKNVTWHSMFTSTSCPGAYLLSKMDYIISEANKINSGDEPKPTTTGRKVGDTVTINGVYVSSDSTEKLNPLYTRGTITRIIKGARNPYLIDNGNLGWTNDSCITSEDIKKGYSVGDVVNINGVYVSSTSSDKLVPAITRGTITRIIKGARNPYLLDNGNIGWVNDNCIVR